MSRQAASWTGAGACTAAAIIFTPLFRQSSFRDLLPLLFLAVIVLVAIRFGNVAGVAGTLAATLVFAIFLFQPAPSLMVEDSTARNHLIWMVLIGVIASDLLGTYSRPGARKGDS